MLDVMNMFNRDIGRYCQKLGEDEHRLRTVDSFGGIPALKIKTKQVPKLREKTGGPFGGRFARFLGDIFNTTWDYETYSAMEFDKESARSRSRIS